MKNHLFLLIIFMAASIVPAMAQDTTQSDPYSDYSYLWDDPKAKKKEAKRKAKEEKKRAKSTPTVEEQSSVEDQVDTQLTEASDISPQVSSDTIPKPGEEQLDSPNNQRNLTDSTFQEANLPSDTLSDPPVAIDTLRQSEDSPPTNEQPAQPDELPLEEAVGEDSVDEVEESEEREEVKEKNKREELPPVKDFRAGLSEKKEKSSFMGGVTYTQIGGQPYVGLVLAPDLNIWKIGLGLDVPILYGLEERAIRTEMFKDGVGFLRLVRYARFGAQKRDPVYVKIGVLDNTMIGYGGLVNNYSNSTSFEKRKSGLHLDVNVKGYGGIEGLYSDFNPSSLNFLSIRPYVRPLAFLRLPIVSSLEVGAVIVKDKDQTAIPISDSTSTTYRLTSGDGIGASGLDAGINLLNVPFIQIDLFGNFSRLKMDSQIFQDSITASNLVNTESNSYTDGQGYSVGLNFRFNFIADLLNMDMRIDRLNYTDNYIPQFFDATYELNKDGRIMSLVGATAMSGIYGGLSANVTDKVKISGNLMLPDSIGVSSPAMVSINAQIDNIGDRVKLSGSYIKGNLTELSDAFVFDERSLAKVNFGFKPNKFTIIGINYYWSFNLTEDGSYQPSGYMSPYFGLSIDF
ncbi:MAG: hypothetical protein JXQ90_16915 [Cyclobacteriaceae bacterium]